MSYKIQKMFIGLSSTLFIVLLSFLNQTCTESPPNSSDNESFSFQVKVVDNSNKPLPNLKIGVYFHFTNQLIKKNLLKEVNNIYGVTVLKYSVSKLCRLTLIAYDLENNAAMEIINNDRHTVGIYEAHFITGDLFPGVYKCFLEAKDTLNNNTLFRDTTYAILWHKDPVYNAIGFTDNNGIFETRNKLYFPSLYNLPELIRTLENGPEPVGTFGIEDSITILVTDTISNLTSRYTRKLMKNTNNYELLFPGSENEGNLISKRINAANENENKVEGPFIFKPSEINSVDLEYFNYELNGSIVTLKWKTNSELNNQGFEIQRSSSSYDFLSIGYVNGMGNTNEPQLYSFIDKNLTLGDYKYRLKIMTFDGTFDYSDTLKVSILMQYEFSLFQNYPNPFN